MTDTVDEVPSSQATGTKRRRVDSEADSNGSQTETVIPPEKYKELHFDDASIVLRCSKASFRVHRSMLAAHSGVFRDMFALAQPGATGNNELPIVHLSDDAEEMYHFLKMLYFHVRPAEADRDEYFGKLLSLWELSRKYVIKSISDYCEEVLRDLFPDTLQAYQRTTERRSSVCQWRGEMLRCVGLAKVHDLHIILPAVYHSFCDFFSLWTPENMFEDNDWPDDPAIAVTLYTGRHKLLKLKRDVLDIYINRFLEGTLDGDAIHCSSRYGRVFLNRVFESSTITNDDYLDDVELFPVDDFPLAADATVGVKRLCDKCRQAWRDSEKEGMAGAWDLLPGCFSLGTWEKLRKGQQSETPVVEVTEDGGNAENGNMDETG